jgi:drug/metabolite transporter (DMT)-like permease
MFLIIVLYALLALTFILAKNALLYATPCFLIGFRMIVAGSLLLMYCRLRDKQLLMINSSDRWLFVKASFFHIYCAFVLEFWALQYVSALKTNMIYSATPFIAALLSYWLLNERLSWQKISAILIGLCGLMPVLITTSTSMEMSMEIGSISLPEIVLFGAVVSAVYAWFLIRELMHKGYHLGFINGLTMFVGGVGSLLTSFAFESAPLVTDWPLFLWWVSLLIIVANFIFYNLYAWLLKSYSITLITLAGFLSPLFGVLYEWWFMNGVVTWHYFVSILFVALGLYIFYKDDRSVLARGR